MLQNEEEQSLLPNVENLSPPPYVSEAHMSLCLRVSDDNGRTINYGSTVLDHQKAKERLGVIIKSKKVYAFHEHRACGT